MTRFQRLTQAASLSVFLAMLFLAVHPWCEGLAADFFLRLDPLLGIGSAVASRRLLWDCAPGLLVLLSALLAGRFFCGHICPMGITLDILQSVSVPAKKPSAKTNSYEATARYRGLKYVMLAIILAAAVGGVSLVYLGSPLSLVTRLMALVFHPVLILAADSGLEWGAPLLSTVFPNDLAYLTVTHRVFSTNFFVAAVFTGLTALACVQPRFWCRNLCPAGAMLSFFSRSPVLRRSVDASCTSCGRCIRECPTGAISEEPERTSHHECVACLHCVRVCPVSAVSFSVKGKPRPALSDQPNIARRGILLAAASGLVTSAVLRTEMYQPLALARETPLRDGELIRPPGSLPEPEFLARCVRCGECMKVCPTNTLQPVWLRAGLQGMFTPVVTPRLGACAVGCAACGQVCPTGAIRKLSLVEKNYAKVGSAWVSREYCLAWARDKKCLVCDEVCPYKAVSLRPTPNKTNAVPFVLAHKCAGCGWCESKCPVEGTSAIRVNIIGEIRLSEGSYMEKAQEYGLELRPRTSASQEKTDNSSDSSYVSSDEGSDIQRPSEDNSGLPPGFSPK